MVQNIGIGINKFDNDIPVDTPTGISFLSNLPELLVYKL